MARLLKVGQHRLGVGPREGELGHDLLEHRGSGMLQEVHEDEEAHALLERLVGHRRGE